MTDRTAAQRQANQRQRRKEAGMVLIRVWVPADKAEAVRKAIKDAIAKGAWVAPEFENGRGGEAVGLKSEGARFCAQCPERGYDPLWTES